MLNWCNITGHKYLYNFGVASDRCICSRCKEKYELDLHSLEWKPVLKFSRDIGTDEEIIKRWSRNVKVN